MQNASSLVKYHTPILVNTTGTKNIKKGAKKAGNGDKQTTQTEDILNSILPPRFVIRSSFYHSFYHSPFFPSILLFCLFISFYSMIILHIYCSILLYCIVLHRIAMYCAVSYCIELCCIILYGCD